MQHLRLVIALAAVLTLFFIDLMYQHWKLYGEAQKLMFETEQPMADWALLWFTGAFGGGEIRVRVRDTDQSPGNRALEEIQVDHLFLRIS